MWVKHYREFYKLENRLPSNYMDQRGDNKAWIIGHRQLFWQECSRTAAFAYAAQNISIRKQAERELMNPARAGRGARHCAGSQLEWNIKTALLNGRKELYKYTAKTRFFHANDSSIF